MKYITKKLKNIRNYDIFGHQITLTMNHSDKYQSAFGGFVSLLVQACFLVLIVYSLYKLFNLQNFQAKEIQINMSPNYGFLTLNQEMINLAFKFDQSILNNWTNPFMNISVFHVIQYRNSTSLFKVKNKIGLKKCDYSDFQGNHKDQFDQLGLNTALCLAPDANLSIQGDYQEEVFSYVQFILTACIDTHICQSNKTIADTMSKIGIFIRKIDNFVHIIFI